MYLKLAIAEMSNGSLDPFLILDNTDFRYSSSRVSVAAVAFN
jgi:hypothetical protein